MKKLQRYDLDRCYSYGEYNKAINYGNVYNHLEGVNNYIAQLNNERKQYEQEMSKLIDSEKDNENRKYRFWEKWRKIKFISLGIFIGSLILAIIGSSVNIYGVLGTLISLLILLLLLVFRVMPVFFAVAAVMQVISRQLYSKYVDKLREQLYCINRNFDNESVICYQKIDDVYLNSLDVKDREAVLMRREQKEHQRKMEEIAEEQRRLTRENLEENRRIRYVQEQLLGIEQERENRRLR